MKMGEIEEERDRDALNGLKMMKKLTIKKRKALDAFNVESRLQKKIRKNSDQRPLNP